ncbi:hypothetical protein CRUP_020456 [Coryphaenoides rupestris]|nr:hypothetical protein CRUP_020456 [Coryphaenoides rupestris]
MSPSWVTDLSPSSSRWLSAPSRDAFSSLASWAWEARMEEREKRPDEVVTAGRAGWLRPSGSGVMGSASPWSWDSWWAWSCCCMQDRRAAEREERGRREGGGEEGKHTGSSRGSGCDTPSDAGALTTTIKSKRQRGRKAGKDKDRKYVAMGGEGGETEGNSDLRNESRNG